MSETREPLSSFYPNHRDEMTREEIEIATSRAWRFIHEERGVTALMVDERFPSEKIARQIAHQVSEQLLINIRAIAVYEYPRRVWRVTIPRHTPWNF